MSRFLSTVNGSPAGDVKPEPSSLVGPETLNGDVDYNAFTDAASSSIRDSLISHKMIRDIQDQTNGEVRKGAITSLQKAIQEAKGREAFEGSLEHIFAVITHGLGDGNFQTVLISLQIVDEMITKVDASLLPFIPTFLSKYLIKVGSHKNIIRQRGMRVVMNLMRGFTPSFIMDQLIKIGLEHKQGKVREEALHIMIASLLTFPKSDFDLMQIVKGVAPLLVDGKSKVRQACFEMCALLSDKLGKEHHQVLISEALSVDRNSMITDANVNLNLALHTRISRKILPTLNEHGLVEYGIEPGLNNDVNGYDVDWILAGREMSSGTVGRKKSSSGPLGRKMPWDKPPPLKDQTMKVTPTPSLSYTNIYHTPLHHQATTKGGISKQPPSTTSRGYADIYKPQDGNHPSPFTKQPPIDSLSTTWPRQANIFKNSRQIPTDTSVLGGNLLKPNVLPAIGPIGRPSSKPIVRNPLPFHPHLPPSKHHLPLSQSTGSSSDTIKATSPTLVEESFLAGGPGTDIDDDEAYFNMIPVDDSQLNCSLSSSMTSLIIASAIDNDERKKNGLNAIDSLSQIRKKAANEKAKILSSTQCSANTSPTSTPPLTRTNKFTFSNKKSPQNKAVSAPGMMKKRLPLKTTSLATPSESLAPPPPMSPNDKNHVNIPPPPLARITKGKLPFKKNLLLYSNNEEVDLFATPQFMKLNSNTSELNSEAYTSPMKQDQEVVDEGRTSWKVKRISPTKSTSAPQKPTFDNIISNSMSNSAPVCRLGRLREEEEENEEDEMSHLVELSTVPNPEVSFRRAQESLSKGSEEWEEKCEALFLYRRLVACHPNVVIPHLQTMLREIDKEMKNLRSQVARSAIACLGDMFSFLGRYTEPYLDEIVKTLLQVGSKSNTFYREDAEKTLLEMCQSTSPYRSLIALINGGLTHSSHLIRRQVAGFMSIIIEYWEPAMIMRLPPDVLDKTIRAMSILLEDADPTARYQARSALHQMSPSLEFDVFASRCLSGPQYSKMKETAETLKLKGLGKPPLDSQSAKTTRFSLSSSFTSANLTGQSPPKQQQRKRKVSAPVSDPGGGGGATPSDSIGTACSLILVKMKANDWKERQESITQLEALIVQHPNSVNNHITKIFDVFNDRLNDNNSKVNLHALQSFQRLIPLMSHCLHSVLATLIEALSANVASRYPTIHTAAIEAIDTLIYHVDCTLLFPLLASAALNGNARVQPIMLNKLSDMVGRVHDNKPALLVRTGLPLLWKILSSRSPATNEAKMSVTKLCIEIDKCVGTSQLLSNASIHLAPPQQQKLRDIIHNSQNR